MASTRSRACSTSLSSSTITTSKSDSSSSGTSSRVGYEVNSRVTRACDPAKARTTPLRRPSSGPIRATVKVLAPSESRSSVPVAISASRFPSACGILPIVDCIFQGAGYDSLYVVHRYSTCKKREEGADGNRRSIGHLSREWIGQDESRMGTKSALPEPSDQLPRSIEQLSNKSTANRPAQRHDSSRHPHDHQCHRQLRRSDPRSDRSAQFHVSHAHTSHPAEESKHQGSQADAQNTLFYAVPAMHAARRCDTGHQKRHDQPVRNAATAHIRNGGDGKNNQGRPPGDRMHTPTPSPLARGRWWKCNLPSKPKGVVHGLESLTYRCRNTMGVHVCLQAVPGSE